MAFVERMVNDEAFRERVLAFNRRDAEHHTAENWAREVADQPADDEGLDADGCLDDGDDLADIGRAEPRRLDRLLGSLSSADPGASDGEERAPPYGSDRAEECT